MGYRSKAQYNATAPRQTGVFADLLFFQYTPLHTETKRGIMDVFAPCEPLFRVCYAAVQPFRACCLAGSGNNSICRRT